MSRPGPALADRLRLVCVTPGDREPAGTLRLVEQVLEGGVTCVWLREPQLEPEPRARLAEAVVAATRAADALCVVAHDVELARRCRADGVHLGWRSGTVAQARAAWPEGLVSRSAHWPLTADDAQADWVTLSPLAPTPKAVTQELVTAEQLRQALETLAPTPLVALGGLDAGRIPDLPDGPCGVAVRRALSDARDPRGGAAILRSAVDSWLAFGSSAP